ncbi:hypothetical protein Tco_0431365 [Tanacetum coccineum]
MTVKQMMQQRMRKVRIAISWQGLTDSNNKSTVISSCPTTTLPAAIPRFEENSGQSFSSVEVEKEGKDIGFLGALVTRSEVADGYGGKKLPQIQQTYVKNLNSRIN